MFVFTIDLILYGLAFILGLLVAPMAGVGVGVVCLGLMLALGRWQRWGFPKFWQRLPPPRIWLIATAIALLAMGYLWLRTPQPSATDISRVVTRLEALDAVSTVQVEGNIETFPLPNRAGRLRFFMSVDRYEQLTDDGNPGALSGRATGRLYITVPAEEGASLHPSQRIAIRGFLYQPRGGGAAFYRAFNFQRYLQREGVFAGLAARQVRILDEGSPWGLWALRQRIYQAQVEGLGEAAGPVVSAMVLGGRAVSIPFDIRDAFRRVGLSHAIAASGFHTSVILGVVMFLARPLKERWRLALGGGCLILFACLSGFAPSAIRAVLMGIAGLLALSGSDKLKALPLLLAIAVGMLIVNPLWIEDLGFQLSFLATAGLIISANPIAQRVDFLPAVVANLIAIPLAATIWLFPLSLAIFGIFPVYGIIANVSTTFILSVVTMGGFISALGAVILPILGSGIAWLLYYPTMILLWMVEFFGRLPGAVIAFGALGWSQVFFLYGLILLVWLHPWWKRRWLVAMGVGIGAVLIPFLILQTTTFRVTILDNHRVPIMVIQQPEGTVVINSGDRTSAGQSVGSFLALQGINRIDWAIASDRRSRSQGGWTELHKTTPIRRYTDVPAANSDEEYRDMLADINVEANPLRLDQELSLGAVDMKLLRADPAVIQFNIRDKQWLLVTEPPRSLGQATWLESARLPNPDVLWWWGQTFDPKLVDLIQPRSLILSSQNLDSDTVNDLQQKNIPVYWTGRDGAIRWTPEGKIVGNQETGSEGGF